MEFSVCMVLDLKLYVMVMLPPRGNRNNGATTEALQAF